MSCTASTASASALMVTPLRVMTSATGRFSGSWPPAQGAAQVTVSEDTLDAAVVVDDGGHAEPFFADLDDGFGHGGRRR